jgi:hypothetical protein
VPFVHYTVDFALKEITTAKGEKVTLCEIESNAPLEAEYIEHSENFHRWGRVIEAGKPLTFDSGCFSFVAVKNCCGDIGIFAIAHTIPDEPTFQSLVYEGDELVVAKPSTVSMGSAANFDFAWFSAGQRLRIETIPDIETHDKFRMPLLNKRDKKQEEDDDE